MANKKMMGTPVCYKGNTNIPRVSLYEAHYPEKLIEHGKLGHSFSEFCAEVGVSEETGRNWRKKYPEFKEAYSVFISKSKAWWNKMAQEHIVTYFDAKEGGTRFDTNLFKFITGGRFGMSHQPDIDLPELEGGTLEKRHKVALKALARGELTPNQAATISTMLKNGIDIENHSEIKSKIEELENRLEAMSGMKIASKVAEEPEFEVVSD